jgi:hypothetical protein
MLMQLMVYVTPREAREYMQANGERLAREVEDAYQHATNAPTLGEMKKRLYIAEQKRVRHNALAGWATQATVSDYQ